MRLSGGLPLTRTECAARPGHSRRRTRGGRHRDPVPCHGDQAQDGPRHGIASESIWPGSPGPGRAAAVTSATVTFRLGPGVTGSVAAAAEAYYVTSTQSHSHAAVETVRVGRRGPAAGPGLARDSRLSRPGLAGPRPGRRACQCHGFGLDVSDVWAARNRETGRTRNLAPMVQSAPER